MAEQSFRDARMLPLYRRLLPYAVRRRLSLAAVASTMLLDVGMNLLKPWPMAIIVDSVLGTKALPDVLARAFSALPGDERPDNLLLYAVLATVIVFLLGWALSLAAKMANISFGERMQYDLAGDLLRHLQRLSLAYHSRRGAGDLIRRITIDSGCVATIIRDGMLPVVTSVVSLVSMFLVMLAIDPVLTVLSLFVLPPLLLGLRRFSAPMAVRDYEQQEAEGRLYEVVEQSLSGVSTVQAFGGEPREVGRFRRVTHRIMESTLAATAVQLRFKIWVGTATTIGTGAVLYVGGLHALDGELSVGEILVFLAYLSGLYGPLESLMYTSSTLQGAAGSAYRVMEVLDTAPEVADGPGVLEGRASGHVRLEGVEFGYEPGRPVLHGVSLSAPPGSTVAVVGPTGAGKSTLVGLVLRLFDPDEGRVTLDGVDLRDVRLDSVRSQVSLVLQESFLFPVSVADNIRYGRPGASMEEVVEAAKTANAHEFIERLPDGYATVLGERGATLSGGQRQRLSIARALAKDAPVLVLDEPTSAVDAQTEASLLQALERLMQNRTTLVIAHRLSTIRNADSIVVLDHGRVVETGTHDQLLARHGLYSQLHAASEPGRLIDLRGRVPSESGS